MFVCLFVCPAHTARDRVTHFVVHDISREDAIAYLGKRGVCGNAMLKGKKGEVQLEEYLVDNVCGCRYSWLKETLDEAQNKEGMQLAQAVSGQHHSRFICCCYACCCGFVSTVRSVFVCVCIHKSLYVDSICVVRKHGHWFSSQSEV